MTLNDSMIGFDGGSDDVSVVVMRRSADGLWRVEPVDGPEAGDMAQILEAAVQQWEPAVPPAQPVRWLEQVAEWAGPGAGPSLQLDDEQSELLLRLFEGGNVVAPLQALMSRP